MMWELPIPGWAFAGVRYLDKPMFVHGEPTLRDYLTAASPLGFRSRMIFTGPDPLQRVRFPYHRGAVRYTFDDWRRGGRPHGPGHDAGDVGI